MNNRNIVLLSVIVASALLSYSCVKEKIADMDYPFLETLEATEISTSGAVLNASIGRMGDNRIIDHGFIWNEGSNVSLPPLSEYLDPDLPSGNTSDYISLGELDGEGKFSAEVTWGMTDGHGIYFRAFAVTESGVVVIGDLSSFVSQGCDPPVVSGVSPQSGFMGDTITITGSNFSTSILGNIVNYGSASFRVISYSGTRIKCLIPIVSTAVANLTLSTSGHTAIIDPAYEVFTPQPADFTPKNARIGELITITGSNFMTGNLSYLNNVYFGNAKGNLYSVSRTELKVYVPGSISAGTLSVKYESVLANVTFDGELSINAPIISAITKTGTFTYTINGTGFNNYPARNITTLGDEPVTVTSCNSTVLNVMIPAGFPLGEGDYRFKVSLFGQETEFPDLFHYTPPVK